MSGAEVGAMLRELRGDIPRKTVADAVGVSVSAMQMYENGARIPRDETKRRIAEFYQTTVADIFFRN